MLRIGIDVQANEVVTTKANDRAHLVFLDGTSLTVGPDAQLTIDRFVYDPDTKTGELAINASQGVFRFVGGKISKTSADHRHHAVEHHRHPRRHRDLQRRATPRPCDFVFGSSLTVTASGPTRPSPAGSQVVNQLRRHAGHCRPGLPPGRLNALAPRRSRRAPSAAAAAAAMPTSKSQNSGFSGQNSGQFAS